jgi:carbon-monoxide dehydrogenase small subunit
LKKPITLTVNGDAFTPYVSAELSLLQMLREDLGLTGTKSGCNMGDCGACTVILDGRSVNACLVLACECDGAVVQTIEGIAEKGVLHPVQEAFIEEGAIQCGYCTPGMVMQTVAFLKDHPAPSDEEARAGIEGNICRCTGYEKIVAAIQSAAKKMAPKE